MIALPRWAVVIIALLPSVCGCGASVQEVQAGTYASAQQVCVAQSKDYDGGLECLKGVKQVFCGPGGVFADAGANVCEGGVQ